MRIVITGASGNVGTALLGRLGDHSDHELIGVVRRPPAPTGVYRRVRWHRLDLADPDASDQLRPIVTGADAVIAAAREVLARAGIEPEYLELRSPDDLAELDHVDGGALLAVAAQVGKARLIDNRILEATA